MKIPKSVWTVSIRNHNEAERMPVVEYRERQKEYRTIAKSVLNNKFDYKTEKEALTAFRKLPQDVQQWVEINECFPINMGLGWC